MQFYRKLNGMCTHTYLVELAFIIKSIMVRILVAFNSYSFSSSSWVPGDPGSISDWVTYFNIYPGTGTDTTLVSVLINISIQLVLFLSTALGKFPLWTRYVEKSSLFNFHNHIDCMLCGYISYIYMKTFCLQAYSTVYFLPRMPTKSYYILT